MGIKIKVTHFTEIVETVEAKNITSWYLSNGDIQFQIVFLSLYRCPVSHSSHLVDDTVNYLRQ